MHDGQDVYVHSHSVELSGLDFSMLEPGTALSFELFISPSGKPQVNTIKLVTPSSNARGSKNGG